MIIAQIVEIVNAIAASVLAYIALNKFIKEVRRDKHKSGHTRIRNVTGDIHRDSGIDGNKSG